MPLAQITPSNYPPYQIGGVVAALVNQPMKADVTEDVTTGYNTLMNEALHDMAKLQGNPYDEWLKYIGFTHTAYSKKNQLLKNLSQRGTFRLQAAHMAMYFVHEARGRPTSVLLGGAGNKLSLNKIADHMAVKRVITNPANFETRVWRPTKPIIHIMVAIANAIHENELQGFEKTNIGDIIFSDLILRVIDTAPQYARLIATSKAPVEYDDMIPFLRQ